MSCSTWRRAWIFCIWTEGERWSVEEKAYVIIRGTVEQIVFYNQENGYAVLRLAAEGGAEVTATGAFPNIGLGEEVT